MRATVAITILCDTYRYDPALGTSSGFSCLIQFGARTILFDTGVHSPTLLYNMQRLALDPQQINAIVLSHIDTDHVGGLFGILEKKRDVTVYIPSSFPAAFKEKVKSQGAEVVEICGPVEIFDGVQSTGELGTWIKEQSLILRTEKGVIIVVGCAHTGIVSIVEKVKEVADNGIYLVLGGFHLGGASVSEVNSIMKSLRELGVQKVAPCHCTGDSARKLLQEEYKEDFMVSGVGKRIEW